MGLHGGGLARRDVVPPPRSLARAAGKAGAVFGLAIGLIAALMATVALEGVPGGHPRSSIALFGLAWGAATGVAFALLVATVFAASGWLVGRDRKLWNVRQEAYFETSLPREVALALAVRALESVASNGSVRSDLRAGTASARVQVPSWFAARSTHVTVELQRRDEGGYTVVFRTAPGAGRSMELDYGTARAQLDAIASRFESLFADLPLGVSEVLGLDALPAGAAEILVANGDTIGSIRPAGDGEAALCVQVFDRRGEVHHAAVVRVPEHVSEDLALHAAQAVGGFTASGGAGFAIVGVPNGGDPARVARGLQQFMLARREGYRGALRVDASGQESPISIVGARRYGERHD